MIGAGILANAMNGQMMRDDLADASARRLEQMAAGPMTPPMRIMSGIT